eukprot:439986-Pleurochrysis_carterae.AAC.1
MCIRDSAVPGAPPRPAPLPRACAPFACDAAGAPPGAAAGAPLGAPAGACGVPRPRGWAPRALRAAAASATRTT